MPTRDLVVDAPTSGIHLLVAGDEDRVRSMFAALLCEAAGVSSVIEARDGAEAVEFAGAYSPEVAVLDLKMPRLDGVDAALALRALDPAIQVALQSSDPDAFRERPSGLGLPLFDKLDFEQLLDWVERQAAAGAPQLGDHRLRRSIRQKTELICSLCGYGIVSLKEPERCPMCGASAAWAAPPHRLRSAVDERLAC
jgi:CheY-like chemotaxis protein